MISAIKTVAALCIIVAFVVFWWRILSPDQLPDRVNRFIQWANRPGSPAILYGRILQAASGLFLLVFGSYLGREHFHLITSGARASGTIVSHVQEQMPNGQDVRPDYAAFPVVRFYASDRIFQFRDWLGARSQPSSVGFSSQIPNPPITVLYDPANPSSAMIDRPFMNWIPWAPIMLVGLLLLFSSLATWLRSLSGRAG